MAAGLYSKFLLDNSQLRCLTSVDDWAAPAYSRLHAACVATLSAYGERSVIIKAPSLPAVAQFHDGSVDFIHIDGAHDYDNVRQDLEAWYPKMTRGALFSGHDYHTVWPDFGVVRAVRDFADARDVPVISITCRDVNNFPSWYWFKD